MVRSIEWRETYRRIRSDLLVRTREIGSEPLQRCTTLVTDVTELIVLSDEAFRVSERCQVFDAQPARAVYALAQARRYNDLALGVLREDLPPAIEAMREELLGLGEGEMREAAFAAADETVRDALVELDLTVYEAREARGIVEAKIEAGRQGPGALCDSGLDEARQLIELRERREDQNDVANALLAGFFALVLIAHVSYVTAVGPPAGPGWTPAMILIAWLLVAAIGWALYNALLPLIATIPPLPVE